MGAAVARGRTSGLQLGGVVNLADGTFRGVQLAQALSITRGDARGLQLSGFANYSSGAFIGAQIAPLGYAERLTGLQLAALDLAGEASGLQVAAVEVTGKSEGVQIAAVNVTGETAGVQIGAVNVARRARGFQLGAVNIVDEHDGEALGALTIARNGIHDVSLYATESMAGNLAVKLGTRHLYSGFLFAYHPGQAPAASDPLRVGRGTRRYGFGFAVGWRFGLDAGRFEALEVEASSLHVASSFDDLENVPTVATLRADATFRLAPHLALFGGPSLNVAVAGGAREVDIGPSALEAIRHSGSTTVRIYPGFVLGVRL
jgi:hypothetical protein